METRKIGNFEITDQDLQIFISRLPQEQQMYAQMPEFQKQCEQRLEEIALFAALGEESKLEETEDFKKAMEVARRDLLSQLAMASVLRDIDVTDEDITAYYEANKSEFMSKPSAAAKHILVETEEKANEIKAKIEAGEISFEDAAKESSSCPSSAQGGDLGTFGPGQMVPEFDEAVFGGNVDELIGPVQTQFGFHLIVVTEKNDAKQKELDEVNDQVTQTVVMQKQNDAYQAKADELRAKYL